MSLYTRFARSKPKLAPSRLLVGLGNPGTRYAQSRHNVGFQVADRFVRAHRMEFSRRRFHADLAEGEVDGVRVRVAKPMTFMNLSGDAVGRLVTSYHVSPQDVMVVYDDLDLPLGKLRLKSRGSSGGHHGMESIITRLGTSDFPRLRIGIGRPDPGADIDHVLGRFSAEERHVMEETYTRAVGAIELWLSEGIGAAMNKFN